jgi:hypothetical protein
MDYAFEWIKKNGGIDTEGDYVSHSSSETAVGGGVECLRVCDGGLGGVVG